MTDEKLNEAYYQLYHFCTDGKLITGLHKTTSIAKADITSIANHVHFKPWLAKQAVWQVHTASPNEFNHPHYDVRKPNEQYQFDLLYLPINEFEESIYKYIITSADVASSCKIARFLSTGKASEVAFVSEPIYKSDGVFKY